jgi:hypothetical protein
LGRKACMWHGDVRGVVCRRYRWKRSAAEMPQNGLGNAREKSCPQSDRYARNCPFRPDLAQCRPRPTSLDPAPSTLPILVGWCELRITPAASRSHRVHLNGAGIEARITFVSVLLPGVESHPEV